MASKAAELITQARELIDNLEQIERENRKAPGAIKRTQLLIRQSTDRKASPDSKAKALLKLTKYMAATKKSLL